MADEDPWTGWSEEVRAREELAAKHRKEAAVVFDDTVDKTNWWKQPALREDEKE